MRLLLKRKFRPSFLAHSQGSVNSDWKEKGDLRVHFFDLCVISYLYQGRRFFTKPLQQVHFALRDALVEEDNWLMGLPMSQLH
jgi:hypothetical protein